MTLGWRSAAAADCVWADWDGDYVLFHRPSGRTHFVNAATAVLLQHVLAEPKNVEDASLELAASWPDGYSHSPALRRHVEELLVRLEELALVTRVPA